MWAGQVPIIGRFMRGFRRPPVGLAAIAFVAVTGLLAACNNLIPDIHDPKQQSPNIVDQIQSIDLLPRNPKISDSSIDRSKPARAVVYDGSVENADNAPR